MAQQRAYVGIGNVFSDIRRAASRLRRRDWLSIGLAMGLLIVLTALAYLLSGNAPITIIAAVVLAILISIQRPFRYIRHLLRNDSADENPWRSYFDN